MWGYYYDGDISQYYLRRRQLVPALARFAGPEPRGPSMRDANKYCYVFNRPLVYLDYRGLDAVLPGRRSAPNPFEEFPDQINEDGCVVITLDQYVEWIGGLGTPFSPAAVQALYWGCVGFCALAQNCGLAGGIQLGNGLSPETGPGTVCFLDRDIAEAVECPSPGQEAFVFAKEGAWNGNPLVNPRNGQIECGSVVGEGSPGHFNYISFLNGYCVWMNHCKYDAMGRCNFNPNVPPNPDDPQLVTICDAEEGPCMTEMEEDEDWPARIYGVTCRCCTPGSMNVASVGSHGSLE
jgi:hypothetical protein